MCYTISISSKTKELSEKYKRHWSKEAETQFESNFVIKSFINPLIPVIMHQAPLDLYHWGIIPSWTKSAEDASDIRTYTYNAMSETMFDKPSFRKAAASQRCAIPVNGFFEWQHLGKNKQPYYIYLKDDPLMTLAGLYDIWKNPKDGSEWHTCNIVTCPANPLMSEIHNSKKRMPVILDHETMELWLNPLTSRDEVLTVCMPYERQNMAAHRVGPLVNGRAGNPNSPESIKSLHDLLS